MRRMVVFLLLNPWSTRTYGGAMITRETIVAVASPELIAHCQERVREIVAKVNKAEAKEKSRTGRGRNKKMEEERMKTRQERRNPQFSLVSFNAQTAMEPGRRKIMQEVFEKEDVDVVGLQESRLSGVQTRKEGAFLVLVSGGGKNDKKGELGVEMWIGPRLRPFLRESYPDGPRMLTATFRNKTSDFQVTVAHAPPEKRKGGEAETEAQLKKEKYEFRQCLRKHARI